MSKYYDGDIVERGGHRFRINYPQDIDHEAPWDDGDGRGIVRITGSDSKRPGERVLFKSPQRAKIYYFDWAGTMEKAKMEGWGVGGEKRAALEAKLGRPPTRGQALEVAVQSEFDTFRTWLNDQWTYVGIVVTHIPPGYADKYMPDDYEHAVWGFESNDDYLYTETDGIIDVIISELDEAKIKADADAAQAAQDQERHDMANHEAVVTLRNAILWSHFTDEFKLDLQLALAYLAESAGTDYPPK